MRKDQNVQSSVCHRMDQIRITQPLCFTETKVRSTLTKKLHGAFLQCDVEQLLVVSGTAGTGKAS